MGGAVVLKIVCGNCTFIGDCDEFRDEDRERCDVGGASVAQSAAAGGVTSFSTPVTFSSVGDDIVTLIYKCKRVRVFKIHTKLE